MKYIQVVVAVVAFMSFSISSHAGQATSDFGVCLTDSLTGKERKSLAKWIFFSIAAHPEIESYATVTEKTQTQTNEFVGALVTRLITEDCPERAKAAFAEDGAGAFEKAFGLVGQVAMQELMTDKNVSASISGFEKYLDKEKFSKLN